MSRNVPQSDVISDEWFTPSHRAMREQLDDESETLFEAPKDDSWNLALTDGSTTIPVETWPQLQVWLDANDMFAADFLRLPVAKNMPEVIRAEMMS